MVLFDGQLISSDWQPMQELFIHNFVYQTIRTADRNPLHLEAHLEIAQAAFLHMYNASIRLDAAQVAVDIEKLLAGNGYPASGGALVRLAVVPRRVGPTSLTGYSLVLSCCGKLLYPDYVLWHRRMSTVVMPYESFLDAEPCFSALINASYAEDYAKREGFDAAIHTSAGLVRGLACEVWCEDCDGQPTHGGLGEYPLFLVHNGKMVTPSLESGVPDSVPRRLGLKALAAIGVNVSQRSVEAKETAFFDEIFSVTPQGVVSLRSCDKTMYFNLFADKLAATLSRFDSDPLLQKQHC